MVNEAEFREKIIELTNLTYTFWVLITIFSVGLRAQFRIMAEPVTVADIPATLGSLYHFTALVIIGAVIPKSKKYGKTLFISHILTMVISLADVVYALGKDLIAAMIALGSLIVASLIVILNT